jgi:hypothetical protein
MIESPPPRDYSAFKDWSFSRLDENRVKVCQIGTCNECFNSLVLHSYVLTEKWDTQLLNNGLHKLQPGETFPPQAHQAFAGAPILCDTHYKYWLEGKILPSEEGVEAI